MIGSIRKLVEDVASRFGLDPERFVNMANCESTLNQNSINYSYYDNGNPSGLFQHISGYWPARAEKYGYAGASVFDPTANAEVTAQMLNDGLSYMWSCKY